MEKKNLYYILAAVVLVVVVVLFFAMKKPAEVPETPTAPVVEEETPVLPEPEVPTEYAGEAEMVTSAVCSDGKVGAVITNVADAPVTLMKEWKVQIRGLVVKEPGCDKTTLEPGESTTCTTLNGAFAVVEGMNEVVIRMDGAKEGKATVTC